MKREKWSNGQIVLTGDLERLQSTKEAAITERFSDIHTRGILKNGIGEFGITIHPATADRIDVAQGVAYTKAGERVHIAASTDYDAANQTLTSPNGLGGFVYTPKSSGNISIPMVSGKYNYIFIKHLNVTDTAVVSGTSLPGELVYPKVDDGYTITVVSELPPLKTDKYTAISDPDSHVYLGYVDYTLGGSLDPTKIFSSIDDRESLEAVQVVDAAARTELSPVFPTAARDAYTVTSPATTTTLNAHVNAVGSGVITNTNPHGLTLQDLDVILKSAENHEKYIHEWSITAPGTSASTDHALYANVNAYGSVPFPDIDEIVIEGLGELESIIFNGNTVNTSHMPNRYFTFFRDTPTGSSYLPDGTYKVYINTITKKLGIASVTGGVGNQFFVQEKDRAVPTSNVVGFYIGQTIDAVNLDPASDIVIWQIDFTTSGTDAAGGRVITNIPTTPPRPYSNFTNRIDLRVFGTIGTDQLYKDAATATIPIAANVAIGDVTTPNGITSPGNLSVAGNASVTGIVNVSGYTTTRLENSTINTATLPVVHTKKVSGITMKAWNTNLASPGGVATLVVDPYEAPTFIMVNASAFLGCQAEGEYPVGQRRWITMQANAGPVVTIDQLSVGVFGFDTEGNQRQIRTEATCGSTNVMVAGVHYQPGDTVTFHMTALSADQTVTQDTNHRLTLVCG